MLGRLRTLAVLAALAIAAAAAGLTALPPLDRDEARFAQASTQMAESGDYLRIYFQDEQRNKKPAGIYWLQAASVQMFSDPEARAIWAYRLPSVLGLVITVIAAYAAGCILLGRRAAFAGAALLAVGVLAGTEAGIAKTDMMLTACVTVAMAALAALYEGRSRWYGVLFWFAIACGVLIKGPIAPMVAGLSILALVAVDRRLRWLSPVLFWPGLLLAITMIGGWLYSIQVATDGAFLREALLEDLGPKLVSAHESHNGWIGYHATFLAFLIFPGTLFLVPGLGLLVNAFVKPFADREAAGLRFLGAWAIPSWIVFELLPTKLIHYVLPLYPALALIAGAAVSAIALRRIPVLAHLISVALFAAVGGVYAFVLLIAPRLLGASAPPEVDESRILEFLYETIDLLRPEVQIGLAAVAGLLLIAPIVLWRAPRAVLLIAVAAGLAWHWSARYVVAPSIEPLWISANVSERLEAYSLHPRVSPNAKPPLVSVGYNEPSLIFLTDTDTVLTDAVEAARLAGAEAGRATLVEARDRPAFEAELAAIGAGAVIVGEVRGLNYSRGDQVFITIYRRWQRARERLDP
ncbi:MAG: glycosyltransferase family 39 protein, partial [Maricaulaceae bacterium]